MEKRQLWRDKKSKVKELLSLMVVAVMLATILAVCAPAANPCWSFQSINTWLGA